MRAVSSQQPSTEVKLHLLSLPTPFTRSLEKLSSTNPFPGAKEVEDHWVRGIEGLSKKEKELINVDNSVVTVGGEV